jgi:hypothetical protein
MVAMEDSLLTFESSKTRWKKIYESLKRTHPQCVTFDPSNPNSAYCGTFGNGLWKTDDYGETWDNIGMDSICSKDVMSISVSPPDRGNKNNKFSIVYVGTEPTAIYTSDDGGESWQNMSSLNSLKSSSSWSFPPRPWTHHVRGIESDKTQPGYVYVAIEAGALVQSHDGGRTWIDKVEGGPYDTHTMTTHKKMPGRLYSAAGNGYFESYNYANRGKDQQRLCLSIMVTSLVLQLMWVILKLLLYLRLNGSDKHISLKLLNQWFTEEHHLGRRRMLITLMMIMMSLLKSGS